MRASLVEEIGQDYLMTARAKGLRDRMVRRRHAVPNALLPTITLIFLNIGFVVSGADHRRDGLLLARASACCPSRPSAARTSRCCRRIFLLFSIAVVVANVVADIVVAAVDPRVRT